MMTEDEIRAEGKRHQKTYFRIEGSREDGYEFGAWQFAEEVLGEKFPELTEAEIWTEDDDDV